MNIIHNRDKENSHFTMLKELINNSNEVLIVTPFISSNFNLIPQRYFQKIKALTFVTTLPRLYDEQEKKIGYFLYLLDLASQYGFILKILIDDSLHGKVYIGKTKEHFNTIITSANFTKNGLQTNNEWGVCFNDKEASLNIWQTIVTRPQNYELSPEKIHEYNQIIKSSKIAPSKKNIPAYNFQRPIPTIISMAPSNFTCWLKPIGTQEHPVSNDDLHDTLFRDITFKVRPVGVKEGDIIICYAAYRKHIVSVYRARSKWFRNASDLFSYSIKGENLFPYYGSEWFKSEITINTIKSEIISGKQFTVTPNGANDYKRLQQADKMIVTSEYANYVIQKLEIINNKIASLAIID
ncbi:MAG TPA: hypothetical protein DHV06_13690 [Bacteroides thetaiotaomicron]|uniref:restriction endonuclease PLD domain-containing protein n=2 Tax=Bacteroides TaxID=816 RepID=UPI000EC2350E|nr:restriction endonuclease PLD domain-containing protein [Bacteroides nordii]HCY32603.1 hypothetical protein [Bacteroides thetaiotaomicron]